MYRITDSLIYSDCFKRKENQDLAFRIVEEQAPASPSDMQIFAVLDGVATRNGKVASHTAAKFLRPLLRSLTVLTSTVRGSDPEALEAFILSKMKEFIMETDLRLRETKPGCCTTVSIALIFGDRLYCCNVGDSPIFLVRIPQTGGNSSIISMYSCQNKAGLDMESNLITEEQALASPDRHLLMARIGGVPDEPPLSERSIFSCSEPLSQKNIILLGSDGALGVFTRLRMMEMINETRMYGLQEFRKRLFDEVDSNSDSSDNFTLAGAAVEVQYWMNEEEF